MMRGCDQAPYLQEGVDRSAVCGQIQDESTCVIDVLLPQPVFGTDLCRKCLGARFARKSSALVRTEIGYRTNKSLRCVRN